LRGGGAVAAPKQAVLPATALAGQDTPVKRRRLLWSVGRTTAVRRHETTVSVLIVPQSQRASPTGRLLELILLRLGRRLALAGLSGYRLLVVVVRLRISSMTLVFASA
jgi:hypothetical protein